MKTILKWIFLSAALYSTSSFALTVHLTGGVVTSATGVIVNGDYYNVNFVDGTCNSIFPGCVTSAFTFQNATDAFAASNALLNQVFLGAYDDLSVDTFGCDPNGIYCTAYTPYNRTGNDLSLANAYNLASGSDPVFTTIASLGGTFGTTGFMNNTVWAVWTPTVPVPAAVWMFGSALVGLVGLGRRKRLAKVA